VHFAASAVLSCRRELCTLYRVVLSICCEWLRNAGAMSAKFMTRSPAASEALLHVRGWGKENRNVTHIAHCFLSGYFFDRKFNHLMFCIPIDLSPCRFPPFSKTFTNSSKQCCQLRNIAREYLLYAWNPQRLCRIHAISRIVACFTRLVTFQRTLYNSSKLTNSGTTTIPHKLEGWSSNNVSYDKSLNWREFILSYFQTWLNLSQKCKQKHIYVHVKFRRLKLWSSSFYN
jgi:hypothetical protein